MESEFLSLQKFLMKGIGLSWSSKNSFVNHKLVFMAGFASMTSIILAMAAYIYENSEDLGKITDASTLMLQGSTSLLKTICFLVYKKEFKNIYYKLYDIYKKANNEFKTSIDILKSFHDKSRRISKAYVWLCILAGGSAQLVPLVRSSISYLQTRDTFQRLLPYLAMYVVTGIRFFLHFSNKLSFQISFGRFSSRILCFIVHLVYFSYVCGSSNELYSRYYSNNIFIFYIWPLSVSKSRISRKFQKQ